MVDVIDAAGFKIEYRYPCRRYGTAGGDNQRAGLSREGTYAYPPPCCTRDSTVQRLYNKLSAV